VNGQGVRGHQSLGQTSESALVASQLLSLALQLGVLVCKDELRVSGVKLLLQRSVLRNFFLDLDDFVVWQLLLKLLLLCESLLFFRTLKHFSFFVIFVQFFLFFFLLVLVRLDDLKKP
jgi:hypothetical protein